MLSPILQTISLTIEDIPTLDIFAKSEDITNINQDDCQPMFVTESASLLVNELEQADINNTSESYLCEEKRVRKGTACDTEFEMSLESTTSEVSPKQQKRKQSLLADLKPRGAKFDRILIDEESIEDGSIEFLGKRKSPSQDDNLFELNDLYKNNSSPAFEFEQCFKAGENYSCNSEIKTMCKLGHRLGRMSNGTADCYLCRSVLANIKHYAEEKGGKLVSTTLYSEVYLSCEFNHEWSVCYKKATKSWCKDCKVKRKQVLKEMIQAEDERIQAERKIKQEKLFEDVRKRVQQNDECKKKEMNVELENFNIILEEITRMASKYAREFCQKNETAEYDQILLLYQTLILPDKCLATYLNSLSKAQLRQEFRRYTILLHPDKNNHPKAKQAFQKAYSLFTKQMEPSN